jgi:hypothetical protein
VGHKYLISGIAHAEDYFQLAATTGNLDQIDGFYVSDDGGTTFRYRPFQLIPHETQSDAYFDCAIPFARGFYFYGASYPYGYQQISLYVAEQPDFIPRLVGVCPSTVYAPRMASADGRVILFGDVQRSHQIYATGFGISANHGRTILEDNPQWEEWSDTDPPYSVIRTAIPHILESGGFCQMPPSRFYPDRPTWQLNLSPQRLFVSPSGTQFTSRYAKGAHLSVDYNDEMWTVSPWAYFAAPMGCAARSASFEYTLVYAVERDYFGNAQGYTMPPPIGVPRYLISLTNTHAPLPVPPIYGPPGWYGYLGSHLGAGYRVPMGVAPDFNSESDETPQPDPNNPIAHKLFTAKGITNLTDVTPILHNYGSAIEGGAGDTLILSGDGTVAWMNAFQPTRPVSFIVGEPDSWWTAKLGTKEVFR